MTQDHAQYAASSNVPLIKSPSLRVPKSVEVPPDMYPLPDSITEYFAYPFTLEPHVITLESSRKTTIAAHAARREACLASREHEKERRKREALQRVAPGYHPESGPLAPKRLGDLMAKRLDEPVTKSGVDLMGLPLPPPPTRSVMDDLVDQLAAMESTKE
ncbi:hypothetical protein FRC01_005629 [Tulasnella sp. 417]|nr:hypothetical protein FRC01_005629 [Tulasnella sp. 417]